VSSTGYPQGSFISTPALTLEMHRIGCVDPRHRYSASVAIWHTIKIITDWPFKCFDLAAHFASIVIFRQVNHLDP
jgi:hypothetical protein